MEDRAAIERLKEERKRLLIEAISEGVKGAVVESLEKAVKLYSEETNKVIKETVKEEIDKAIDRNIDKIAQRTVDLGTERIVEYVKKAYNAGIEIQDKKEEAGVQEGLEEKEDIRPAESEAALPEQSETHAEDTELVEVETINEIEDDFEASSEIDDAAGIQDQDVVLNEEDIELSSKESSRESPERTLEVIGIYDSPVLHDWKSIYILNAYPFEVLRGFLKSRSSKFSGGQGGSSRRKVERFLDSLTGDYADNLYKTFSVACYEKFDVSEDSLSKEEFLSLEKDLYSDVTTSLIFFYFTFLEKDFDGNGEDFGEIEHLFTSIRHTCGLQLSDKDIYKEFFSILVFLYIFAVREYLVKRFNTYSVSQDSKSVFYKSRYDVYKRLSLYSHLFSSFLVSLVGLATYKRMRPEFAFFYSVLALFHDFGKIFSVSGHDSRVYYEELKKKLEGFFEEYRGSFEGLFGDDFDFSFLYGRYEEFLKKFFIVSIESHHFNNRDDLLYDLNISEDSPINGFISAAMENVFIADKLSRIFELRVFNFIDNYPEVKDVSVFYQDLYTYTFKEKGKGGEIFYSLMDSGDLRGYKVPKFFKDVFGFKSLEDVIYSFSSDFKNIILEIQADPRAFSSDGVSYSESFGVVEIPIEIFYSYLYAAGWFHPFGFYKNKNREIENSYDFSFYLLSKFIEEKNPDIDVPTLKNMFILMNLPIKHSESKKVVKVRTDILNYLQ
ncbi:hypothetical protein [Persephonella sp. KM09-Lau-8]|uniref:hypothetical protein n=1 Tax=Persephonella sp. KM09-Lau-8 TaxID=1158345 RepID=UPI0018CC04CC|nr:hypothetical protein [Persephonella sp. KM09-Lau-8]